MMQLVEMDDGDGRFRDQSLLATDTAFDRIAALLRCALGADDAMVKWGPPPLAAAADGKTVTVADVRQDPRFERLTTIDGLEIVAYAGAPVCDERGQLVGTVYAIQQKPRQWSARDRAVLEQFAAFISSRLQLQQELFDTKLLQSLSAAMIQENNVDALYKQFVDAAVRIMRSDFGSMQMFFPERGESGELLLLASHGLSPEGKAYWKWVSVDAGSTCGQSLRTRTRTIAEDFTKCNFTLRRNDRAAFMAAGVRSAQSTPLFSRDGRLLGMITTHWRRPHRPSDRDLQLFDILARQAADVLERRLAEKALRESEERFRAFVATSSEVVYRMNADWSEMRLLDGRDFISDTSTPNRGWFDTYIHPDDQPTLRARIDEAIANKSTFDLEHRIIRKDGTLGWTRSRAIPLLDENQEIVEWFGAATDITLNKRAEAQQKKTLLETQHMVETLQLAFLPQRLPQHKRVRIDAAYLAADEGTLVGGDWYDAVTLPDGRILLCVGDVTGHGLSAAVTAGKLRQAATVAALTVSDPAEILGILNRVLRFQHPDMYATAILAFIDDACTELTYANAGHPPAFLLKGASTAIELELGGLPLGVDDEVGATTHRIALPESFLVAFYSDGLTEFRRDIAGAENAMKRIMASVVKRPEIQQPAKAILNEVLGDTSPPDDVVLLTVHSASENVSRRGEIDLQPLRSTWRFHSNDGSAVREARWALAKLADDLHIDPDTSYAAQIILGEALANTVRHAPGAVDVDVECLQDDLVLSVRDYGPGLDGWVQRMPCEPLEESGRGLFLIEHLARELAVQSANGGGTRLRAVLPLRAAPH